MRFFENRGKLYQRILQIIIFILLLFLAFIIIMQSALDPWENGRLHTDSAVFKYVALVMDKGGLPYKDTFDHKGPLLYIINYIGNIIAYYRGIWFIEYLFMIVTVCCLYKISRMFCGRMVSFLLTLISMSPVLEYFGGGNLTEEYALPFLAISIYMFLEYFLYEKISRVRLVVCGMCFGAVFMLRPNMVAVWVVFCLAVLIWNMSAKKEIPWTFLCYFILGAAFIIVPIIIWLICGGAFNDFIYDYIVFNLKYSTTNENPEVYNRFNLFMRWLENDICVISLASTCYLLKTKKDFFLHFVYLVYFIVNLLMISISGVTLEKYALVLLPMFIYPLSRICGLFLRDDLNSGSMAVFLILLLTLTFPSWNSEIVNVANTIHSPNESVVMSEDTRHIIDIIQENTVEDDEIQVIGNRDDIYVYSQRMAASKYSYQIPIAEVDEKIEREFKNDLQVKKPKIVIVQSYKDDCYAKLFATREWYDFLYEADDGALGVYILNING